MSATVMQTSLPANAGGFIRPVDTRRDLGAVADLVEICFRDTLDPDSRSYLKQMRSAARASRLLSWTVDLAELPSRIPVTGYVWEMDGRLVGNLSLIPFRIQRQKRYLIANVAVHPEYRRKGIARQLTVTALDYLKRQGNPSAWLHVRSDNPHAIHLYETLGFEVRTRRTTWYNLDELLIHDLPTSLQIGPRRAADWSLQRRWLAENYPAMYAWHLPLDWSALEPTIQGILYRFFSFIYPRHWVARQDGTLLGSVSRLPADGYADALFLAVPENVSPTVIQALLTQVRRHTPRRKHLTLNTPADLCPEAIQYAGFYNHQTLLWMEVMLAM